LRKNQPADAAKVEFSDGLRGIRYQSSTYYPVQKLQVYIYTLIIAVLSLQLTVDRNEKC